LDGATLLRVREPLRQDAIQEAWAAHLAGENPNDAVRSFVRRNARAERRFLCFSQLDPDEQERIYTELPE
jgi:hypothetical protein